MWIMDDRDNPTIINKWSRWKFADSFQSIKQERIDRLKYANELYKQGLKQIEIADIMNLSRAAVCQYIREGKKDEK
jgi:DNA-binding transcriptional regulator LsrR (DeoR family)